VHLYKIIEHFQQKEKLEEDLQTYTKRTARPTFKAKGNNKFTSHNIQEYAAFQTELDLHIENLDGYREKMSNTEKLRLQLSHFDSFLAKAIRLGVERVFVIHGLGKGKLRDTIADRLIKNPDVVTFKNEYHPKYGFGATEVILLE
jgi:dsDNA-specific endonuclease/ATPase MutS2